MRNKHHIILTKLNGNNEPIPHMIGQDNKTADWLFQLPVLYLVNASIGDVQNFADVYTSCRILCIQST